MTEESRSGVDHRLNRENFTIRSTDDLLRVDQLCQGLLRRFYDTLVQDGIPPQEATPLAAAADYYVRDYLVDSRMKNVFEEKRGLVRQFAATWYIIRTIEPKLEELTVSLEGIREWYRFLHRLDLISAPHLAAVEQECDDLDFYRRRIEAFWDITGDGYMAWERECPVGEEK
ncbi:MAG TPA: hypothetical protein VNX25_07445 [Verrucomicrobiae bacterium]|nr:hypothetical protein [Verrucomicrobiae bacterium]